MQILRQDLRYAVRMLTKKPVFSIIAVITLALGIGANTAIFSVVNAVLLRALPYHNASQLVALSSTSSSGDRDGLSIPETQDFQTRMQSLEDLAAFQSQSVNVTGGERPDRVRGAFVSANFFKVFNLNPVVGRTFVDGEDRQGAVKLAVVNERMWRERLNSDKNVEAKKLILNGEPYSVIGVVPESFKQPFDPDVEVWMPAGTRLEQQYPEFNTHWGVNVVPLRTQFTGEIRRPLLVLLGAVGFVLLIACANVANLLLARASSRKKEIAVRAGLGASRWRITRQLLTESVLLSLIGGAFGLLLAWWGTKALIALSPPGLMDLRNVAVNLPVLGFTFGLTLLTGVVFGLVPALEAARFDLNDSLKEGGENIGGGSRTHRLRNLFVVTQVALALVLLVGAGLFMKSLNRLRLVDPGFNPNNLLTMRVTLPGRKYDTDPKVIDFFNKAVEQLRAIPGVEAAGAINTLPFAGPHSGTTVEVEGQPKLPPGQELGTGVCVTDANYFQAMQIPLKRGRLFTEEEANENASRRCCERDVRAEKFARPGSPGQAGNDSDEK